MRILKPENTPRNARRNGIASANPLRLFGQISGPGRGLTDEFFKTIAEEYQAFVDEGEPHPVKAIGENHHVTISAASRWIKEARRLAVPARRRGEGDGMRGHVHKRGTTWTVVYDEGHDENGRRRQRSKGGFATRRDAQRFLTDVLSRLGDGSYAQPSKVTLAEFLTASGCRRSRARCGRSRFIQQRSAVRARIVPRLGHVRLQALTGGHLNAFYRELEQAGLSGGTIRHTHAVATPRPAGRCPLGQAGSQPRRHGGSASAPSGRGRRRGRRKSSAASSSTSKATGCFRSGASPPRRGCAAASSSGSPGAASTSRAPACPSSSSSFPTRRRLQRSGRPSRRGRGGRSPSTRRPSQPSVSTGRRSCSSATSPGEAYVDADLVFANELGGIDPTRSGSPSCLGQHRKAAGIPTGTLHFLRHTAATPRCRAHGGRPRSHPSVAARLGRRPENEYTSPTATRTCCHSRTRWPPSGSRALSPRCSPVSGRLASGPQTRMVRRAGATSTGDTS